MNKEKVSQILGEVTGIVDNWLNYQAFFKRIPGLAVGIIHENKIIFEKYWGYADKKSKKNVDKNTCFRIASISKLFTALSIMQLVDQEKLMLDDKVKKHLSWFRSEKDSHVQYITLRHLLMHCAGLTRDGQTPHWITDVFPEEKEVQRWVQEGPTTQELLEEFKYSNFGYALLGKVIESVSGQSYEDYVDEHIVKKLNLTHTSPVLTDTIKQHLATGYGKDIPGEEREVFPKPETKALAPAAGFSSNVVDLCKFLSAQFKDNNTLIKPLSQKEMKRLQWMRTKPGSHWGIGYGLWKVKNKDVYGHGGGFQGYITQVGMNDDHKIGVVVLTNAIDCSARPLHDTIFNTIFTLMEKYDNFKEITVEQDLKQYEGTYSYRWGDVTVKNVNKGLIFYEPEMMQPLWEVYELEHKKDHTFTLIKGSDFWNIGEEVTFTFDNGKATSVKIGPNTLQRITETYDKPHF